MNKIGMLVRPGKGHMNPTLPLAKAILRRGGQVVYLGDGAAAPLAAAEGLDYVKIDLSAAEETAAAHYRRLRLRSAYRALHAVVVAGRATLLRERIDVLLVDPTYSESVLWAVGTGIRIYYVCPFNYPFLGDAIGPISTGWRPTGRADSLRAAWLWRREWLREQRKRFAGISPERHTLVSLFFGYARLMREASRRHRVPLRFGLFGPVLEFSHLILGPRELDFPGAGAHAIYLGACVDRTRLQPAFPPLPATDGPLVFASFGTNIKWYPRVRQVWDALLTLFRRRQDWRLILHAPRDQFPEKLPSNIAIHSEVPALDVLAHARAAIIHGGYGTLKECVLAGVPVVVIPFKWDQPGNAARACHHGLGEAVRPEDAAPPVIEAVLERVLQRPEYRAAVARMGARIDGDGALEAFAGGLAGSPAPVREAAAPALAMGGFAR